jgi:hypothetical protein
MEDRQSCSAGRADTGTILNHRAAKHLPQHDGNDSVEKKVTNRGCVSFVKNLRVAVEAASISFLN